MKATIREVAELANVSDTTVSLAFRPKSRISQATRQKVLEAAQRLNYVANEAARNLRHGGLNVLSILVNNITNPFYANMIRTVEMTAESKGYQLMVMESQWDGDREVKAINRILQARVRGVIICQSEETEEGVKLLDHYKVPYVALDTFPLEYKGPYVANNLTVAGKLAAKHLLCDAGCKVPVLAIPISSGRNQKCFSSFARLREGFAAEIIDSGLLFAADHVFNVDLTIEDGLNKLPSILAAQPKVDGILCGNDLCALGVMEAIDKEGLKVGQDIALMGIDDLPFSRLRRISLTSIQQPYEIISMRATTALIEAIEAENKVLVHEMMPPLLVARNSTKRNLSD